MAQIDHKLELLKQVPLFKDLSRHDIEQVGQLTEEVDVPAGQVLTREGAPGSEFFVIVDGAVEIDVHGQIVRTMESGDFLGEIALVDDGPRTATATTDDPDQAARPGPARVPLADGFLPVNRAQRAALSRRSPPERRPLVLALTAAAPRPRRLDVRRTSARSRPR